MSNSSPQPDSSSAKSIPEQLSGYSLIRVCYPDGCRIDRHGECDTPGKRPVSSTKDPTPTKGIQRWIRTGGNCGVVPKESDDLVVVDIDSDEFHRIVREKLPAETFTVTSGSGGTHRYYRSDFSQNCSLKEGATEYGSLRTENWHAVTPPSVHPETGDRYVVRRDSPIQRVPESSLSEVLRTAENQLLGREDGGGGGGGDRGGRPPSSRQTASDLQVEPDSGTLDVLSFINSEQKRREIAKVFDHSHPPRNVRVWACSFLYGAVGLRQRQIERLLRETAVWATDNGRIRTEIRSLVNTSIEGNRPDESVNLDRYLNPGDMEASEASESRKTESGDTSPGSTGGESMSNQMDYTTIDSFTIYQADSPAEAEDGDRIVRVELTNMQGRDDNGPVDTDFVTIQKGTLRENGEFGVSPEFNGDSKSVGSADPEDLRLIAEGLQQIAEKREE